MMPYVDNTSLRFVQHGTHGQHLASIRSWTPLPKHTWQLVISSKKFRTIPCLQEIPRVLRCLDLYI